MRNDVNEEAPCNLVRVCHVSSAHVSLAPQEEVAAGGEHWLETSPVE